MKTSQQMIKDLRKAKFTQKQIASECGTDQSTISRIEKGQACSYEIGKRIEHFHNLQKDTESSTETAA